MRYRRSTTAVAVGAMAVLAAIAAPRRGATQAPAGEASYDRSPGAVAPSSYRSGAEDRESMSVTVYNQNFALVREIRSVDLATGLASLEFGGVAAKIQTETVHIRALRPGAASRPLRILEQNSRYDLLSPQKLLEKYVGRTVTIYRWNAEQKREEPVEVEVVAVNQGTILRIGDVITFNYPGRIAFPEVPDNLIAQPTLVWLLDTPADRQRLEVSYLTDGLDWRADYVIVLGPDERRGGLTGWVTLTNNSGATYENARLKLVAGDVERVRGRAGILKAARALAEATPERPQFAEEAFFEYHLYTLKRPTTLRNAEQKQVALLEADGFGLHRRLIFRGGAAQYRGPYGYVESNAKVGVYLEFRNSRNNRLGMPLPAGVVRVYKSDESGAQQFIGEDRIDHTPRDEGVRIKLGDAFDVVGDRRQMEYRVLGTCASESTWEVTLRNHKDQDASVEVVEPAGGDWNILSASHPATRIDAHTFRFDVKLPARDSAKIRYRVRVRWC